MPRDAEFKGYEDVVVQDLIFCADNVGFHKEKYWAPSMGQTFQAPLPLGYGGQFGPGLKALTVTLYFGGGMSEPKILCDVHGVQMAPVSWGIWSLAFVESHAQLALGRVR